MPAIPSIMNLHLRYRLWIAELNADINALRILNDYIIELENKNKVAEVVKGIDQYKKQFTGFRKEIDELSHEMHLLKMKLATLDRENKRWTMKTFSADDHKGLKGRYASFRKVFSKAKREFEKFEGKWLS
jgi:uncharacterized coiled-coil DUF342 family protein